MANRLNWAKNKLQQQVVRDDVALRAETGYYLASKKKKSRKSRYKGLAAHVKEIERLEGTNKIEKVPIVDKRGTYLLPYVEHAYSYSGFSRDEFVRNMRNNCLKEQNWARQQLPTKYKVLPLGKYKNKDWCWVLKNNEKYILWFYWNIENDDYRIAMFQNIDIYRIFWKSFGLHNG